ncbi:hypothetical protein GCM10010302_50020 [Streptomyces polychromogenes]|uniref:Indole-3-glycerol-phosphate synthase n=1 Tax=Streptomyces polychromogenes TaxID=67342 RepID=A0ABN0VIN1_9ACTN
MTGLVREIVVHDVCLDDAVVLGGTGCAAEVDVACTRDGVAVVLPCAAHLAKETALRTVADTPAKALDPAVFPPVEAALAAFGALGLPVVLDLKAGPGEEARAATAVLAQVPRPGNTRVIGFNHRVVRLVSAQWGMAACGVLFAGLPMDVAAMATEAGSGWVVMQSRFLEPGLCAELRSRGIRTMTFSASTQKRWEEALASGADSVMAEPDIAIAAAGGTSTTGGRVEPGSPAEPSAERADASGCHRPQWR